LLSKLAVLELCGWIEGEFDELVIRAATGRADLEWLRREVITRTNGFSYGDHLRPMLCRVLGEILTLRAEARMEEQFPGELEQFKSMLGSLWKIRCGFAHADVVANVAAQQVFNAPSWSLNQHRLLRRMIDHYDACLNHCLAIL
jgi:hypothetical protein